MPRDQLPYPAVEQTGFLESVKNASVGKKLPDGVYVHREAITALDEPLVRAVEHAARAAGIDESAFDVVRFDRQRMRLSLLAYPDFFDLAFPVLATSWAVDLVAGTVRTTRYAQRVSAPVLHRKEALLAPGHPRRDEFAAITGDAERLGLFEGAHTIGTRAAWEARLQRLGVRIDGNRIVPRAEADGSTDRNATPDAPLADSADADVVVQRHRTALQRYSLSTPMQALFRHGYLSGGHTVFDYGCGRGDDVKILQSLGLDARGWDPHFARGEERRASDVVNLGFVINVIENTNERADALRSAFQLARRVLSVSALIGGRTVYEENRLFADGVLTTRGTFQKYFQQHELRQYLEAVLGREPVAIAPGLFFVFPDDDEEQNFLAARQLRARCNTELPRAERAPREPRAPRAPREPRAPRVTKWETHRPLIEDFWNRCLELGRPPRPEEYAKFEELRAHVGAAKTVLAHLVGEFGAEPLEAARRDRMNDVLVYLALNVFERRRSVTKVAPALRSDVAAFWTGTAAAQEEARRLLFSIADAPGVLSACREAAARGIGYLDGDHSLIVRPDDVQNLLPLLRVYVHAGVSLYGDLQEVDLVKIHTQSGKLSLLRYDGFEEHALPTLRERIKINLRRQTIDFFGGPAPDRQLCYPKSRYLAASDPGRAALVELEAKLRAMGLAEDDYGCLAGALETVLATHRVRIDDQRVALVRTRSPKK